MGIMANKLLIDMIRLREYMIQNPDHEIPEGWFHKPFNQHGLKTVRELAVFRFVCRKCEDAPCISVCPADALEKDSEGIINRHTNLCVSCKSCVTICPFGTMMTDFFRHHRNKDLFHDLNNNEELKLFVESCPPGVASLVDHDEMPEKHIHKLNDKTLIRDYLYPADQTQ
jgi:formate dehydrogenase iron-sulfur subunit